MLGAINLSMVMQNKSESMPSSHMKQKLNIEKQKKKQEEIICDWSLHVVSLHIGTVGMVKCLNILNGDCMKSESRIVVLFFSLYFLC